MEFELRKKALSRLNHSGTSAAISALKNELGAAVGKLKSETEYDRLEEALSILEIIADRFSVDTTAALVEFTDTIENRTLDYPRAGVHADEVSKYQNARTLIGRAIEVLLRLRYLETTPVLRTLMKLSRHEAKEIRDKAISAARTMAHYDLRVFYGDKSQPGIGALPQLEIVSELEQLGDNTLRDNLALILEVSDSLLSPTIEGTTWTYKALTISRGAAPAAKGVSETRKRTVTLLKRVYRLVEPVTQKLRVIAVLNDASRPSHIDTIDADTAAMLTQNTLEVLRFYEDLTQSEPLQILEKIESNTYWIYFHSNTATIEEAAFRVRDALNAHSEYQIYKTLIGFEGIFGDWRKLRVQSDIEDKDRFREIKAKEFAASISPQNYAIWRARILEYAKIESNDLATFPILYKFLEQFALAQPPLAHKLVTEDADKVTRFLIALLRGLWAGPLRDKQRHLLGEWTSNGRYLRHIAAQFFDNELLDVELLQWVLRKAIEVKDELTVSTVLSVAVSNYVPERRALIEKLFSPALAYLTQIKSAGWIFDLWFRRQIRQLIPDLSKNDVQLVLENMLSLKKVDYHAEELLYYIASREQALVLEFFAERLRQEAREGKRTKGFEAIPYSFHKLQEPLGKNPRSVLNTISALYDGNYGMFIFRGARLVRNVFPTFPPELTKELLRLVHTGKERDLEIVLAVLRTYEGPQAIHEISKAIIKAIPDESRLRTEVAIALQSTGVVTGEYGFAEAYERKADELREWLEDPDTRVQEFARWYISSLEKQIEAERKRVAEEIALRKQQYGE